MLADSITLPLSGPVDKSEGVVKAQNSFAVFSHHMIARVGGEPKLCQLWGIDHPAIHRYGLDFDHGFLSEHPFSGDARAAIHGCRLSVFRTSKGTRELLSTRTISG
jgi:hypothetical protein